MTRTTKTQKPTILMFALMVGSSNSSHPCWEAVERAMQHEPPREGAELIGWKIKATFPTGPRRELRWHDGFVVDHRLLATVGPSRPMHQYRFFYPIDDNEEWVRGHELPHDSICFRKPHLPEPRHAPLVSDKIRFFFRILQRFFGR